MIWYFSIIKKQEIHDTEVRLIEHEHKNEDKFIKDEYSVVVCKKDGSILQEKRFKNKSEAILCYSEFVEFYENEIQVLSAP